MSDIVAFIRARLDEDEQAAQAAEGEVWRHASVMGDEFEQYVEVRINDGALLADNHAESETGLLATIGVQDLAEEAASPLPEDAEESEQESRDRIEALMTTAASWGFSLSKISNARRFPEVRIIWDSNQPRLSLGPEGDPRALLDILAESGHLPKFGLGKRILWVEDKKAAQSFTLGASDLLITRQRLSCSTIFLMFLMP
jgi:hypothetical protein